LKSGKPQKSFFKRNGAMFSYKSSEYITPPELFKQLDEEFHFTTDPCTTPDNPLKVKIFFTKEQDGIKQVWRGNVFINPPYGKDIFKWIIRARLHAADGNVVVMLLPARTDTRWFHELVWNLEYDPIKPEIRFIRGRLKFGGTAKPNTAPFPSMLVIFRGNK
jgi:phage N-6-adenine-methyltransferase